MDTARFEVPRISSYHREVVGLCRGAQEAIQRREWLSGHLKCRLNAAPSRSDFVVYRENSSFELRGQVLIHPSL